MSKILIWKFYHEDLIMIRIASLVSVTIWLVGSASCHDLVSPCPDIFQYEPNIDIRSIIFEEDTVRRWYGVINLRTTKYLDGLSVDIALTNEAISLGTMSRRVISRDNREFSIQDAEFKLEAGKRLQIRFFTQYRESNNEPALRTIRLNGWEICPDGTLTGVILPLPRESSAIINSKFSMGRPRDKFAWTKQCFMYKDVNPLVTRGQTTKKGEWPWHIAIYYNEHDGESSLIRYKCGGSLISESHALTAAHCLIDMKTGRPVDIRGINIYLGTHNIKTFSVGVQFKLVDRLEIHQEYNSQTQYKDIAILKLNSPAEFTAAVRPVCLWPEDKVDLNHVTDKYGSVVGWGYDEFGLLADELMLAKLPVVSELTCLRSHAFYQKYTNNFTYCAGLLQGTSVCNGDSGGGMVFRLQSPDKEEWFLRGIVSLSPVANNLCDLSRYAIFTDVAKFLDWIKDTVSRDM